MAMMIIVIIEKLIGGWEGRQRANTSVWQRIEWKRMGYDDDDDEYDDDDDEGKEEEEDCIF